MAVTMYLPGPVESGELYGPLNRQLGVNDGNLPEGLIHHFAMKTATGFDIFEVWETQEAFERFARERLMPTLQALVGDKAPQIQPTIGQLYNEFRR